MRPAFSRLGACQGVSGVFKRAVQPRRFVSQSLRECHGVDVKTVVRTEAPRVARGCADSSVKISQEFTWRVTASQGMSWRVSASQRVSGAVRDLHIDPLPASRTRDTVRRMVARIPHDVQEVAAEAGPGRIRLGWQAAWRGTRNTVPSIAFSAGPAVRRCRQSAAKDGRR